ncbi:sulfatase [Gimesia chilikensis]|uniref:sulfatase family protein n=1 Tax=Gimesia chilikensis TaxID=2605989 RepID=UPI001188B104|nr:sulfatase [Gimesia chilikensis]QDT86762.1 Arylsulfatase precursor [Gimesia chilikensis]
MKLCKNLLLVVLVVWGAYAAPRNVLAEAASRPNIVMIISDDQAWNDYGFMGHEKIKTPNLDKLAAESAVFKRGYVPTSLCRPSLMTMITGLYPHQNMITGNDPPKGMDRQKLLKHVRAVDCLPQMLGKLGYKSYQCGKWWEGNPSLAGFTSAMTHGDPKRGGRHGDLGLKIGREGMKPVYEFIDECKDEPFFLWYAPFLPHTPHNPPQRILKKYLNPETPVELSYYYAMVEWFDETCGQLLDYLDQKQLSDNTIVVYVTDNGWIQYVPESEAERKKMKRRFHYAPKSKRSPYDGGLRTPILLRWPGKIKPAEYDTLVSSIDLAPTILDAVGLKPTKAMEGINLLQVIQNGGKTDRKAIFGEIFEHDMVDIDDPVTSLKYRWCIEGEWKAIFPGPRLSEEKPELYNLSQDPFEHHNAAAAHPELVQQLLKQTNAWWNVPAK